MSEPTVKPGDTVRVTVTKVLPFDVLVGTATGLPVWSSTSGRSMVTS